MVKVGDECLIPRTNGTKTRARIITILPSCPALDDVTEDSYSLAECQWEEMRPQFQRVNGECIPHVKVTLEKWVRVGDLLPV